MLALEGAKDRLQLFKANLLEEGSFDAAVTGCEGVFHTASPFTHAVDDPQVHSAILCACISNLPRIETPFIEKCKVIAIGDMCIQISTKI